MTITPEAVSTAPAPAPQAAPPPEADFEQIYARLGARCAHTRPTRRQAAFDGFRRRAHESKLERDRRYGSVYAVTEFQNGYLVSLELPRSLPRSSLGSAWGLDGVKPQYHCSITLAADSLIIRASLAGEKMRRAAYVSRSVPADFQTRIQLAQAGSRFADRLLNDTLEIVVLKHTPAAPPRA